MPDEFTQITVRLVSPIPYQVLVGDDLIASLDESVEDLPLPRPARADEVRVVLANPTEEDVPVVIALSGRRVRG